jgi:hypothetical protein
MLVVAELRPVTLRAQLDDFCHAERAPIRQMKGVMRPLFMARAARERSVGEGEASVELAQILWLLGDRPRRAKGVARRAWHPLGLALLTPTHLD